MRLIPSVVGAGFLLFGLLVQAPAARAGGIPGKTLKELKAASVYVKVKFGIPLPGGKTVPSTGSGFVLRVDGETGFIGTNFHVVHPPKEIAGLARIGPVQLVFDSGTPKERTLDAEIVAADPIRDLAILKVTGAKDLPAPLRIDPNVEVNETMTVYAFGFPFGGALGLGKANPAITVTKGTVSSLRNDAQGNVHLVQIDAEINPGNSGGPVVDEKGQLVGIAVSKIDKSRIGFAVPVKPLADIIVGKVASVGFDTVRVADGKAQIEVEANLLDPLGRVKDLAIHYAPASAMKERPKADKDGNFPLLEGTPVPLEMKGTKANGKFSYVGKARGKSKEAILYQAVYVNGEGKKVVSAPANAHVDFTQVIFQGAIARDDPVHKLRGQPHKVFEVPMEPGKFYVIEMRGDIKDLDPYLGIEDAEGKKLAEDDDSGGLLNALLVFTPPRAEKYKIIATVLRGTGDFTLRIREETGKEVGPRGFVIKTTLQNSDPLDKVLGAPSQTYNVVLRKGKSYTIDMKSREFDTFLRVENMAGVGLAADDDSGGELNSRIMISMHQDGIFRVIATSFDRNVGEYDLSIVEGGGMEVGPMGLRLTSLLNPADGLDPVLGKNGVSRAKVFEVKLQAGQRYQIDMASAQIDSFLRVEDAKGKQLADDDDSGGMLNASLIFTPPADGVYRIFAASLDGRLGNFVLQVRKR